MEDSWQEGTEFPLETEDATRSGDCKPVDRERMRLSRAEGAEARTEWGVRGLAWAHSFTQETLS